MTSTVRSTSQDDVGRNIEAREVLEKVGKFVCEKM